MRDEVVVTRFEYHDMFAVGMIRFPSGLIVSCALFVYEKPRLRSAKSWVPCAIRYRCRWSAPRLVKDAGSS
jgi:hypothetical protein